MRVLPLLLLMMGSAAVAAPLEVQVDPRVEVVAAIFRLAGAREYSQGRSPYLAALAAHLAGVREHPAVAATRKLREAHDIGFDAPMQLALYLDPRTFRPLRPLSPRPPGLDERWEGVDVAAYVELVRRFAEDARFAAFLDGQAARLRRIEARFRELAQRHDLQPWLDATYGPRAGARSVVVPGLQSGGSNFGITVELPEGRGEVLYQVLMLENVDAEGVPRPGDVTLGLWAHEASHPYVNPIVDAHLAALRGPGEALYARVATAMRRQAYPDPRIMLRESVVRAQVIRFLRERLGAKAARLAARDDEGKGFVWIDELVAELDAAPRPLGKAMPRVVAFFEKTAAKVSAEGLPRRAFRGPINAVYSGPPPGVLAARSLLPHVAAVLAKIGSKSGPPRAVEGLTWKDVGAGGVVVYASPESSPLVAEALARHGATVAADRIEIGGQRFSGGELVLIVARPRPDDAMAGVLLYTAAKDEWLVGVNLVFHGPTDWVVARRVGTRFETVASGDF